MPFAHHAHKQRFPWRFNVWLAFFSRTLSKRSTVFLEVSDHPAMALLTDSR